MRQENGVHIKANYWGRHSRLFKQFRKLKMKNVIVSLVLILTLSISCSKEEINKDRNFVFVKPYCTTIPVGGFVGIKEVCFNVGDIVVGEVIVQGKITFNISIQNYITVPSDYLKEINN
jgi:hypothetical protein